MSSNPAIKTRPPSSPNDIALLEKFSNEIVKQSDRLDDLAKQLFTLELAIPGIYATVLKLVSGEKGVFVHSSFLYITLLLWFMAFATTLVSLFPRKYQVMQDVARRDTPSDSEKLSVEEFYISSAAYKYRALAVASLCFFGGVITAFCVILFP
jgi:hypothetical protein